MLVVDRLTAVDGIHSYEVNWNLDVEKTVQRGLNLQSDSLQIFVSEISQNPVKMDIKYGSEEPKWVGWTANSVTQGDFRPVYYVTYTLQGKDIRFVTLLLPSSETNNIVGVEASDCVSDTGIIIKTKDGREICLDENKIIGMVE